LKQNILFGTILANSEHPRFVVASFYPDRPL
jgi:hypothetical protein